MRKANNCKWCSTVSCRFIHLHNLHRARSCTTWHSLVQPSVQCFCLSCGLLRCLRISTTSKTTPMSGSSNSWGNLHLQYTYMLFDNPAIKVFSNPNSSKMAEWKWRERIEYYTLYVFVSLDVMYFFKKVIQWGKLTYLSTKWWIE